MRCPMTYDQASGMRPALYQEPGRQRLSASIQRSGRHRGPWKGALFMAESLPPRRDDRPA
jgi:hypothetical protein